MDPNQEGQPAQGGSVPPTSPAPGMPPAQAGGSPAPTSGMPPAQPAGTPPAGSPVFGTQGTTTAADPAPTSASTPVSTSAPAPGVLPTSGAPATPPLTPRRSFRPAQSNSAQLGTTNQFAQPAQDQPNIIASGSTAGAGPAKKPSRNVIIAIIVVAVLAIIAVIAVIVGIVASTSSNNNSNSAQSNPVNMSSLETAYNNLANYIAFGDENTSETKIDGKKYTQNDLIELTTSGIFMNPVLSADKEMYADNSPERINFFSKLDQLYSQLPENLSTQYSVSASSIYDYYHVFSAISTVPFDDIVSRYKVNGLEPTRAYITNGTSANSDKGYAIEYTNALREYSLSALDLVNDVKNNFGCDVVRDNANKCNINAASSYNAFASASNNIQSGDAYKLRETYHLAALETLLNIHDVISGEEGGNSK